MEVVRITIFTFLTTVHICKLIVQVLDYYFYHMQFKYNSSIRLNGPLYRDETVAFRKTH